MTAGQHHSQGSGPGPITPDGCAVDFYAQLPPGDYEADLIATVLPAHSSILDLGAGTGRVTHPLVARGFSVVAVDESEAMLPHIVGARTVTCRIEDLQLDEWFDAVVLGSHLINTPDDLTVASLLSTCTRHVKPDGVVLIERHAPDWFDSVVEGRTASDGIGFELLDIHREGPDLLTATAVYTIGDQQWRHNFTTRKINDADLVELLGAAGLEFNGTIDHRDTWVASRPVPA